MKRLLLCLLLLPLLSFGQEDVHISSNNPWLFENIEQSLQVESCQEPLSAIFIHSSQGGRITLDKEGSFLIKPRRGNLYLSIYQQKGQDSILLKKVRYSVKSLPQPLAFLGYLNKDAMSKKEFLAQVGIRVDLINYDYNISFPIEKFTLMVLREQELLYFQEHTGNRFSPNMKQQLGEILSGGEQILITNILFKSPYHYHHTANSITLTIKPLQKKK